MTIATARQRENLATAYAAQAVTAAAYTANPGTTGANEVVGAPYARKALTWDAGTVDGTVTATAVFDIPAGVAVAYAGVLAADGTFLDAQPAVYNAQPQAGTLTAVFTFTQT